MAGAEVKCRATPITTYLCLILNTGLAAAAVALCRDYLDTLYSGFGMIKGFVSPAIHPEVRFVRLPTPPALKAKRRFTPRLTQSQWARLGSAFRCIIRGGSRTISPMSVENLFAMMCCSLQNPTFQDYVPMLNRYCLLVQQDLSPTRADSLHYGNALLRSNGRGHLSLEVHDASMRARPENSL